MTCFRSLHYLFLTLLLFVLIGAISCGPSSDDDDSVDDDDTAIDDDDAANDDDTAVDDDDVADDDDTTPFPPTFTQVWTQVISQNCGCHGGSNSHWNHSGSAATAYSELVGVPSNQSGLDRIEPGDASLSYLAHKLNGTHNTTAVGGGGSRMPRNQPQLSPALRSLVEDWVNDGAQNN
jgi:hypothetical protein